MWELLEAIETPQLRDVGGERPHRLAYSVPFSRVTPSGWPSSSV